MIGAAASGHPSAASIGANAVMERGPALRLPGVLAMRHHAGDGACFDVDYYMEHNKA